MLPTFRGWKTLDISGSLCDGIVEFLDESSFGETVDVRQESSDGCELENSEVIIIRSRMNGVDCYSIYYIYLCKDLGQWQI